MASLTLLTYILSVLYMRYKVKEDWFDSFLVGVIMTIGIITFGALALILGAGVYSDFATLIGR